MLRIGLITLAFTCSSLATVASDQLNVLLICIDDLRPELNCFGADYIHSPNIDRLSASGRAFHHHYVNAPTCGASRYTLLTGTYGPSSNYGLFERVKRLNQRLDTVTPSMPAWFRSNGYTTVAVGKVSHHPGGLGGSDWNLPDRMEMPNSWDKSLQPVGDWQHPRGVMHALAQGNIREKSNEHPVYEAFEGDDQSYPDGWITDAAISELKALGEADQPFFLAVGLIRPHLPFGAPKNYLDIYDAVELPPIPHPKKPTHQSTWHRSGEFMKYQRWSLNPNTDADFASEVRRHYAACVSYADAQVGKLLDQLEQSRLNDNTIVILWGDHGWHLGEHAVWGKHTLFEESLRAPLIIRYPDIPTPGSASAAIVETIDLFPTLCELAALPAPKFSDGQALTPQLKDPKQPGHSAIGYQAKRQTIRTVRYRLIVHSNGYTELYDHQSSELETKNIAVDHPKLVQKLSKELSQRLNSSDDFSE